MKKQLSISILLGIMMWGISLMASDDAATSTYIQAQEAELEQLHAQFHSAASSHNIVTGDSQEEIDKRIRQVLALWIKDGYLKLASGSPFDGDYIGRGSLENPAECPAPSGNRANQGTLCTFYKYVAGSFQPGNIFISLTSAYKTHYKVTGNTALLFFECHYFDVAIDPTTGEPAWTAVSHVAYSGGAVKVNGVWRFSWAVSPKVPVPVP
jgi:hypothetical protein